MGALTSEAPTAQWHPSLWGIDLTVNSWPVFNIIYCPFTAIEHSINRTGVFLEERHLTTM